MYTSKTFKYRPHKSGTFHQRLRVPPKRFLSFQSRPFNRSLSACCESRSHDRGSAILSTDESVPLREPSDRFDWTRGLSDLYVSYVPDFGYEENISYTPRPRKSSFWEEIAGLILTPYAPKYS